MSLKPTRRRWFMCLTTGAFAAVAGRQVAAQQSDTTLKEQLEFGLKSRRPEEFAWIDRVVTMVESGELPVKLVTVSFNWARKRGKYPYQYFVRALRALAARQGIAIPPSG